MEAFPWLAVGALTVLWLKSQSAASTAYTAGTSAANANATMGGQDFGTTGCASTSCGWQ